MIVKNISSLFDIVDVEHGKIFRRRGENSSGLILFIHGLFGNPESTWGSFPMIISEERDLSFCDIAHFHYKTKVLFEKQTIYGLAELFKGWLEHQLRDSAGQRYKHIFILAHSLGGLITRKTLINIFEDGERVSSDLANSIRTVFLFAVPHGGSKLASLVSFLTRPFFSNSLFEDLKSNSKPTRLIKELTELVVNDTIFQGSRFPKMCIVYGLGDNIVPKESVLNVSKNPYAIGLSGSHEQITKPLDKFSTSVRLVTNEIYEHSLENSVHEYLRKVKNYHNALPISKQFVSPSVKCDGDKIISDFISYANTLIIEGSSKLLFLLGEYGSGKTSVAYQIGVELAQLVLSGDTKCPIPFYLSLSHARGNLDPVVAFSSYLKRYKIPLIDSAFHNLINNQANVVLILDGFDEMFDRSDWRDVASTIEIFKDLCAKDGIRILLTSRTAFFRDHYEEKVIPFSDRFYLLPFNDTEMIDYLQKNFGGIVHISETLFKKSPQIRELCRTPIFLFLLGDYLSRTSIPKENISILDLYDTFIERNLADNIGVNPSWSLANRRKFLRRFAFQWFVKNLFEVSITYFEDSISEDLKSRQGSDPKKLALQLANSTFFMRIEESYRFIHLSFLEYFVAEAIVRDLFDGNVSKLGARPYYTEIYIFICQLILRAGIDKIPFDKIIEAKNDEVQGNFLAAMYTALVPEVQPFYERLLLNGLSDMVRCVACQGLGMYENSHSISVLVAAFRNETNTITKKMIQRILSRLQRVVLTNKNPCDIIKETLTSVVLITKEDADMILKANPKSQDLRVNAYRRLLRIDHPRWSSTVMAIYLLAYSDDKKSFELIRTVGCNSKDPDVRATYEEVKYLIETDK